MELTKIICKCCDKEIGVLTKDGPSFGNMKAISKLEVDFKRGLLNVKCHNCHNWNLIDSDNSISKNMQRKAKEHLYF
ncbi:hypothetical protein CMT77_08010 [Elizabethkingia anophelis]|nr:hypothetical protein [Elizabethkingia anophelis]